MMIVEKFEKLNYNFPSIYLYKCIYHLMHIFNVGSLKKTATID